MKMMIRFFAFLPLWFVGTFIMTWPVVPVAVLFSDKNGRLPRLFRWWETHDDLGYAGLDQEPDVEEFAKKWGKHLGLIRWLYRNKAYTLRYKLGIPFHDPKPVSYQILCVKGQTTPRQRGFSWLWVVVVANGKRYFEFQPSYGFGSKVLYLRVGWKLAALARSDVAYPFGSMGMYTGATPRKRDA